MDRFIVIVEAELRSSNLNYRIRRSEPLPRDEAQVLFDRVVRGEEEDLLKPKTDVLWARTAEHQMCRFAPSRTGREAMDRVTLAQVVVGAHEPGV